MLNRYNVVVVTHYNKPPHSENSNKEFMLFDYLNCQFVTYKSDSIDHRKTDLISVSYNLAKGDMEKATKMLMDKTLR